MNCPQGKGYPPCTPGCLRAGGTGAMGSLANPKLLPGKFGTLFRAACNCTAPPPLSFLLSPDNLLVLLICYFRCKSLFFLHSPLPPEKDSGLGSQTLSARFPCHAVTPAFFKDFVTRTFWWKKTKVTPLFHFHV